MGPPHSNLIRPHIIPVADSLSPFCDSLFFNVCVICVTILQINIIWSLCVPSMPQKDICSLDLTLFYFLPLFAVIVTQSFDQLIRRWKLIKSFLIFWSVGLLFKVIGKKTTNQSASTMKLASVSYYFISYLQYI